MGNCPLLLLQSAASTPSVGTPASQNIKKRPHGSDPTRPNCSIAKFGPTILFAMPAFTKEQIEKALSAKSTKLGPADIRRIADNKDAVMKMIGDFPESCDKARRQATLLFELIRAAATGKMNVHPDELRDAAGALIYLGAALDIVPDDETDGYTDDAAVIGLAIQKSQVHVRNYCTMMGLSATDYLD